MGSLRTTALARNGLDDNLPNPNENVLWDDFCTAVQSLWETALRLGRLRRGFPGPQIAIRLAFLHTYLLLREAGRWCSAPMRIVRT